MTRQSWLYMALAGAVAFFVFSKTKKGAAVVETVTAKVMTWKPPAKASPFLPLFAAAEQKHGIPPNLLARIAQSESGFDPNAVGKNTNGTTDVGIMQINSSAHPGVDAKTPSVAIDYAGKYLRQLYVQTGTWPLALIAYNWGIGNVKKLGAAKAPEKTKTYAAAIARDVGLV